MSDKPTRAVIKILAEGLSLRGFDGLVQPDAECGCRLDDLVPCGSDPCGCEPGYLGMLTDGSEDWAIYRSAEAAADSMRPVGPPAPITRCQSGSDGDCSHEQCPQARDGEPHKSGRHCPLDWDRAADYS